MAMDPSESSTLGSSNHTVNSTGGCPWEIGDKARLRRFLCYGSEGDIYTAREDAPVSLESAGALLSLLQEGQGAEVVEEIKKFSREERAVRLRPSLFALALCSQHSELKNRQAAFKAVKEVCRDPAHLFSFIQYKKELKEGMKCGIWGRALRKVVSEWYNEQDAMSLAAAVTRCKQRDGWSHQDILRLCHVKPTHEGMSTENYCTQQIYMCQFARFPSRRLYTVSIHCFMVMVSKRKERVELKCTGKKRDDVSLFLFRFFFSAIALISKYVTKGWAEVQAAYADKENSEEVVKVLSYLEVVEKVKRSSDETEVVSIIDQHKLEREQLLTDHLKSKQVSDL